MADYGYLNHTYIDERDDFAIDAVFSFVSGDNVVMEQTCAKCDRSRPAFERMISTLSPGDALYIGSIDRLGLDAEDTVRLWQVITKEKGADIVVLNDPDLNSRENLRLTTAQLTASARAAFAALNASLRIKK